MKLWIATITDKLLAWTKFEQWAAVAKMVPTRKNTLIRTSFEELKTSICWLKSIIQVVNHCKKMRRSPISCESQTFCNITEFVWTADSVWREIDKRHTDIANNYSEENNSWLSMEFNQNNNGGLFRWELQQRGTVLMRTLIDINFSEEKCEMIE